MLKVLYSFDIKNNYIKNFAEFTNFISYYIENIICLIQESTE